MTFHNPFTQMLGRYLETRHDLFLPECFRLTIHNLRQILFNSEKPVLY